VLEFVVEHIARSERRLAVAITSGMGSLAENTWGGPIAHRSSKMAVNMVWREGGQTLGFNPPFMRRSTPRRNASAAAKVLVIGEQHRDVDRYAGEDRLFDRR
jgi:hypothetical protein